MSSEHFPAAEVFAPDDDADDAPRYPQLTASKVALVLECARALGEPRDPDPLGPGEAALYGSCLHEACDPDGNPEDAARAYVAATGADYATTLEEVKQHATAVLSLVKRELVDDGWRVVAAEVPRAWSPTRDHVRAIELDKATHTYTGLAEDEIGGTCDLVLEKGARRMVLDYKTGHGRVEAYHLPATLAQLRVLGEMWDASELAILHCARQTPPILYSDPVRLDTPEWVSGLVAAMARRGDGSLRPGEWCRFCPVRGSCVAHAGEVIQSASALVKAGGTKLAGGELTPGAAHMFLERFERLAKLARASVRAAVQASDLPIVRPDGKVLELTDQTYESVSKASIIKAYGKEEGERRLDELREVGAVKQGTRRVMKARKE